MPLPMVHLAVAMQIRTTQRQEPTASFLLGSLAPDAIHMREQASTDDKHAVHLRTTTEQLHHHTLRDLLERSRQDTPDRQDFAEGYAVHLLTDWHWFTRLYTTFRQTIPDTLTAQEVRALYYQETDQIDFDLFSQMPWRRQVWAKLATAQPTDFDVLLSADEIGHWQYRVLHWFGELKQEPGITPQYLTGAVVQQFIHTAVEAIAAQMAAWKTEFVATRSTDTITAT